MRLVAQHTLERKGYSFQIVLYAINEEKYHLVRCWGPKIIFYTGTLNNHGRHQPYITNGNRDQLITLYNRVVRKRLRTGYKHADTSRFLLRSNPTPKHAFVPAASLLKKDAYAKFISPGFPTRSKVELVSF